MKTRNSKKRSSRPPLLPAPRSGSDWGSGGAQCPSSNSDRFHATIFANLRIRIHSISGTFLAVLRLHTVWTANLLQINYWTEFFPTGFEIMAIHGSLAIAQQAYGFHRLHMEHIRHKFMSTGRRLKRPLHADVSCRMPLDMWRNPNVCTKNVDSAPSEGDIKTNMTWWDWMERVYSIWGGLKLDHINRDHKLTFSAVFVLYSQCICIEWGEIICWN